MRNATIALLLFLVGCGGGASQPPHVSLASAVPLSDSNALSFSIPSSNLNIVQVAFVSHNGVAESPAVVNRVVTGGPACSNGTCLVSAPSPAGVNEYLVSGYSSFDTTHTATVAGYVDLASSGQGGQQIPVVFGAMVAAQQTLFVTPSTIERGHPQTLTLVANELDPSGNLLIGTYPTPLLVTVPASIHSIDFSGLGILHSSQIILSSPTEVKVYYDGGDLPSPTIFTSSAGLGSAIASASANLIATGAPGKPQPLPPSYVAPIVASASAIAFDGPLQSAQVTLSQVGYSGGYFATTDAPQVASATTSGSTLTISTAPIAQLQAGVATITVVGGGGRQLSIKVTVSFGKVVVH